MKAMVGPARFPDDLVVVPICRWPTTLAAESLRVVLETPINQRVPERPAANGGRPRASIVVVTLDGLVFTRLCLESLLASISPVDSEVVVIDNGSTDGSVRYLNELSGRDARVRVTCQNRNIGFAAAVNCGVALAHGDIVILLNNDTIVIDGWLERIVTHLADPRVGLLGAVTNRAGNEAEIQVPYRTYGALRRFARDYMQAHSGQVFDIRTATMFCAALRRQVWDAIGPLDERFEIARERRAPPARCLQAFRAFRRLGSRFRQPGDHGQQRCPHRTRERGRRPAARRRIGAADRREERSNRLLR